MSDLVDDLKKNVYSRIFLFLFRLLFYIIFFVYLNPPTVAGNEPAPQLDWPKFCRQIN